MTQTLIVYGNCQAEALSVILSAVPAISKRFDVRYLRSFANPGESYMELPAHEVSQCSVLIEQQDPHDFPHRELLPAECMTVTFPSIDLNLLWPFNCTNPFDKVEPDVFPFGRFPYGDRIIVQAVRVHAPPAEILEYYDRSWNVYGPPLGRLHELETARLAAREATCDVKMAEYVLGNISTERLFWTVNHPTMKVLRELLHRILRVGTLSDTLISPSELDHTIATKFSREGPLGVLSVPIHPEVVNYLGLDWYSPNERHQGFGGTSYTYSEYFKELVDWSIRIQRETDPVG